MSELQYMETSSNNPYYNLAFEEFVLTHRLAGNYLILWQNDNSIVIGRNQNAYEEINQQFVNEHHIHVARRETGGGAVYHDFGNLNYSFIADANELQTLEISRFTAPVIGVLKDLGLNAECSGRNDILIEGKKVSGTAQRIYKGRILHHGTLLFDSDPDTIACALNADPSKFESKSVKSVRSRVGNIRDFLPVDMDLQTFWRYLKTAFAKAGLSYVALTDDELKHVKALKESKYDRWEWNFGHSPDYNLRNKRRYKGGSVEVCLSIGGGIINEIVFYGDFLSISSLSPLTDALRGCPYRCKDVAAAFDRFNIEAMFGGINRSEVLNVIFNIE